ncbi:hypothetical protein [Mycolicibacterium sp.]|uniref:hypothetical protein n=1 Tax=Mycolicibacterium sp. TaxID=2320850 RepID=UPI0037CA90BF
MTDRIETVIDEWMDAHGMDDMGLEAQDLLDRFKAARIAVVKLPEPNAAHVGDGDGTEWETGVPDGLVTAYTDPPEIFIDSDSLRVDQARTLAAALLAAADAAEASE